MHPRSSSSSSQEYIRMLLSVLSVVITIGQCFGRQVDTIAPYSQRPEDLLVNSSTPCAQLSAQSAAYFATNKSGKCSSTIGLELYRLLIDRCSSTSHLPTVACPGMLPRYSHQQDTFSRPHQLDPTLRPVSNNIGLAEGSSTVLIAGTYRHRSKPEQHLAASCQ